MLFMNLFFLVMLDTFCVMLLIVNDFMSYSKFTVRCSGLHRVRYLTVFLQCLYWLVS